MHVLSAGESIVTLQASDAWYATQLSPEDRAPGK